MAVFRSAKELTSAFKKAHYKSLEEIAPKSLKQFRSEMRSMGIGNYRIESETKYYAGGEYRLEKSMAIRDVGDYGFTLVFTKGGNISLFGDDRGTPAYVPFWVNEGKINGASNSHKGFKEKIEVGVISDAQSMYMKLIYKHI